MNEKICFLIVIIAYAIYHSQREIFFNIIYTLSFIELSYKCLSHNIIKDLFLVPNEPVIKEEDKEKGEIVENAIIDSFRRDKNNLKMLMEVRVRVLRS